MTMMNNRPSGMAYIMTNAANGNEIAAFRRMEDGSLAFMGMYGTNGMGSGPGGVASMPGSGVDPLQSQGSVALSPDARFLFAVNAGSDTISSFRLSQDGSLVLAGTVPAGAHPICLVCFGSLLFAAHAGSASDNYSSGVWSYSVGDGGQLSVIRGSGRMLSMPGSHPAGLAVSPDGRHLVVSELDANRLSVFGVSRDGMLSGPVAVAPSGSGPFGSCFLPSGLLLVAEANSNALASYLLAQDGMPSEVSIAMNGQMATCWVAATSDGRRAYTSNAASGTITQYNVAGDGRLRVIENVSSAGSGVMSSPIDIGVSRDGRNLYALIGNQGFVSAFSIGSGGRLSLFQVLTNAGLPTLGAQGIAVL